MITFREYFLLEGMKTPSELKQEQIYFIINRQDEGHIQINMYKRPQKHMFAGQMIKYFDLWIFHIDSKENMELGHVYAHKGYGPVMYDIAMELASKYGEGLVTPISISQGYPSDESINVYKYYYNKRTDIQKTPFDPEKYGFGLDFLQYRDNEKLAENPWLNMLYTKPNPTTLNELEANNMIRHTTIKDIWGVESTNKIRERSKFKDNFIKDAQERFNIKPQSAERLFNDLIKSKIIKMFHRGTLNWNPEKDIFSLTELERAINLNPYRNSNR
jgi:hypothetical protein